CQHYYDNPYSF
nr:immunoglobulin light chain junction region [Macaca mulatta]MOV65253.1 immunoglobulin light chain junction region [Macaca mulatta]